jgi:hypothetical protein
MPRFSLRSASLMALALCASAPSIHAQCGAPGSYPTGPFPPGSPVPVRWFGAHPNDSVDDKNAIQCALNNLGTGNTLIFDRPGVYELRGVMGQSASLLTLANKKDITITCVAGVRIELTGFDRAAQGQRFPDVLKVNNCTNFTLAGAGPSDPLVFTTRATTLPSSEGLPFLQGAVQSVNVPQRTALVSVTDPELFLPPNCFPTIWAWVLPDGRPGFHAMYQGKVRAVAPPSSGPNPVQQVEFTFAGSSLDFQNWQSGQDVVAVLNDSDTYALNVYGCTGTTTFRNLLAHHLPGKFLQTGGNDVCIVDNVDVLPSNDRRLLSVGRDALNADATSLVMRDCDVAFCGDDAIVSNGSHWGRVTASGISATGAHWFEIESAEAINPWPTAAKIGQHLALINRVSLSPGSVELAEVSYAGVVSLPVPGGSSAIRRFEYINATAGFTAALTHPATRVLNPWPSLLGAHITNCSVTGVRGVGITARGLRTRIDHCFVGDASVCGIMVGGGLVNAYPWFGVGIPPHELRVENCIVDRCGGVAPWIAITGSIDIAVANDDCVPTPPPPPAIPAAATCTQSLPGCQYWIRPLYEGADDVIQNVVLSGNTISRAPRAGLFAANVGGTSGGLQVFGNTFIDCGQPSQCLPETDSAITIENCGNGLVSANTFIQCSNQVHAREQSGRELPVNAQ